MIFRSYVSHYQRVNGYQGMQTWGGYVQVIMEDGHGFHRISRNFHGKSPAVSGCYSSQCANGHPTVEYHGHDFLGVCLAVQTSKIQGRMEHSSDSTI